MGVLLGPWYRSRDPDRDKMQIRTPKNCVDVYDKKRISSVRHGVYSVMPLAV